MKLIFIRHGQTDYNKAKRLQGQEIDGPLNDEGIRQVGNTATSLPEGITRVFCSPMLRTRQSAEIICDILQKPFELRDEIKEYRCGTLAGKTWPEIIEVTGDPDVEQKDSAAEFDYSPYGGESSAEVKERVRKFVDEMRKDFSGDTMLVVSHGGVIDTMHALYPRGEKPENGNAKLHIFEF